MKYSEFYKLIEAAGWTISGGTNHYKYVILISITSFLWVVTKRKKFLREP